MNDLVVFDVASPADWSARICASWRQSVQCILDTGRLIAGAKDALEHGHFEAMIETDLPFGARTAQMLMAIASDPRLTNPKLVSLLPPSWGTLYELHKLDDATFAEKLSDGTICPDVERPALISLRKAIRTAPDREAYQARVDAGCTLADLHALADSGAQFGAISADPNWQYQTWSDKGKDRSPDQHYDTDPLAKIIELPVKQLAAKDSVLHLWCLDCMIPDALRLIDAWGFTYIKVGFNWIKLNPNGEGLFMGLGHWTRDGGELCLLATKGNPKRLDAGVRQVIEAPVGKHSAKPREIHDRIEKLSGGPYLELFARELRENWTCWGDEIPRASFRIPDHAVPRPELPAPDSGNLLPKTESLNCLDLEVEDIPAFLIRRPDNSVPVVSASSQTPTTAG